MSAPDAQRTNDPEPEFDVVVVGAGVAGLAAARSARRAGARVALLDGGGGASCLAGGCWDAPGEALPPEHPLSRLSGARDALQEALEAWQQPPLALQRGETARPLAATEAGRLREAWALDPELLDLSTLPPESTVGVVQLTGLRNLESRFLPGALREEAERRGTALRFERIEIAWGPFARTVEAADALLAQRHAEAIRLGTSLGEAAREAGATALLLPPILGMDASAEVLEAVRRAAGLPLGEWHAPLDPVQGLRRRRRLQAEAARCGAERWETNLERVAWKPGGPFRLEAAGRTLRCGALVLATGRHLPDALRWEGAPPRETLLGLPLGDGTRLLAVPGHPEGPDPLEAFGPAWPCRGEAWRWGLQVDELGRPLDESSEVVCERLFSAGDLLGGHDPAGSPGGLGTALASGWLAGRHAAEAAGAV